MKKVFAITALAASICGLATLWPAAAATPAPPPSINGELFQGPITSISGSCADGSYSFDTSGTANGPYTGTYTAHVDVTSGPTTGTGYVPFLFGPPVSLTFYPDIRNTTSLTESFEIHDASGDLVVSGTKTQLLPIPFQCADEITVVDSSGTSTQPAPFMTIDAPADYAHVSYTAAIPTDQGTYVDDGGSVVTAVYALGPSGVDDRRFAESFSSTSLTPPAQNVPTDKEDCKDGGWRNLTREDGTPFRNQGDCIRYVNTGK